MIALCPLRCLDLARWPIVELASSINLPLTMTLTKVYSLLLELEIKTNKSYKSRSKLGCHKNLRPLEFFFSKKKDLHGKLVSLLVSRFVLWSRNVHRERPERSEIFIFSGLSASKVKNNSQYFDSICWRVFLTEEIEDTESLCCSS